MEEEKKKIKKIKKKRKKKKAKKKKKRKKENANKMSQRVFWHSKYHVINSKMSRKSFPTSRNLN